MRFWSFLGLAGLLVVTAVFGKKGGTLLDNAFSYVVYILHAEDGTLVCLGAILDSITIATAARCELDSKEHLVKLASLPETETECDMQIKNVQTFIHYGELGLTLARLKEKIDVLGCNKIGSAATWHSMEIQIGDFGIVPVYGYPPRAIGLEVVEKSLCKRHIEDAGLHEIEFIEYIVCAQQAKQPVFMSRIGVVTPGMPCNVLGAPFVLNDTRKVLGLLAHVDCTRDSPVAIFMSPKKTKYFKPNKSAHKPPISSQAIEDEDNEFLQELTQTKLLRSSATKLAPLPIIGKVMAALWVYQ